MSSSSEGIGMFCLYGDIPTAVDVSDYYSALVLVQLFDALKIALLTLATADYRSVATLSVKRVLHNTLRPSRMRVHSAMFLSLCLPSRISIPTCSLRYT